LDCAPNCIAKDYIYDMPLQMAAADLVICRAGAMTLSELSKMKKAAILIPSPNVTNDHQKVNAQVLSARGAAILIEETKFASGKVIETVRRLYENREELRKMENAIGVLGSNDANRMIWNDILALVESKKENKKN